MLCPNCHKKVRSEKRRCPHCGQAITRESRFDRKLQPLRAAWSKIFHWLSLSPGRRWCIQWTYFFVSTVLLWRALVYFETYLADTLLPVAILCVFYLATILFLLVRVTSLAALKELARRAPAATKLAAFFNFLTMLVVLQGLLDAWRHRATLLALLIVVAWMGCRMFTRNVEPKFQEVLDVFLRKPKREFDPSAPQGRQGEHDSRSEPGP